MTEPSSVPSTASNNATGGEGPQRPRRVRMSKPKVKTGCNNCKQRRIKCDEVRPECTQCVRSKRTCTGYPPPPRTKIYEEIRIAPRPGAPRPGAYVSPMSPPNTAVTPTRQHARLQLAAVPNPQRHPRMTPPHTPVEQSLTLHRPTTLTFGPLEGQYFQLFREQTASELSGFFDTSFWTRRVLQECHSENAIKHAVVALGALYKTLEKMCESPPSSPADHPDQSEQAGRHWEVAYKHYSLAIRALVDAASQDQAKRVSLMASVLLACFDSFIGDHTHAIVQIQTGLRLLETLRAERRRAFLPRPEEPVEQDLIQMFTRLAIQAKSYDMAFHFPQPYVIRLTSQGGDQAGSPSSDGGSPVSTASSEIPDVFNSLHEARLAWDAICEKTMRFHETMFTYNTMGPMGILPTQLKQYGGSFSEKIEAWSRAFQPILESRTAPAKSSLEKTAIAVLKMNQMMGHLLLMMTFSDSELAFDQYSPVFKSIVNLAMEVIGDEERRAAAKRCPNPQFCPHHPTQPDMFGGQYTARHIKPSFSADLGIVPPLFVVATKCRDPLTRRQATQLLRSSSRREGMWDSELAASIGTWITTIEEEEDTLEEAVLPLASPPDTGRMSVSSRGSRSSASPAFGDDVPLGPGGNARWGSRRESIPATSHNRPERSKVPESKRVMVQAVDFDLKNRSAVIQCGTRGLTPGMPDLRTRVKRLTW